MAEARRMARLWPSSRAANSCDGGRPGDQIYAPSIVVTKGQEVRRLDGILWPIIKFFNFIVPRAPNTLARSPSLLGLITISRGNASLSRAAKLQSLPDFSRLFSPSIRIDSSI